MKVYVACVKPRKENTVSSGPPWAPDTHDVWFSSKRGDLVMEDRKIAQRELDLLARMHIRAGYHYCKLELEEQDGIFAIVCKDHPPLNPL